MLYGFLAAMLSNASFKRLDMAAGTLVVYREARSEGAPVA